ncbi:minor capsid protein [Liquorilactobacillus satsumensis]|uniref:minor capsid protein n=1 Tax=Liquorilactobacillus satsumensis TaxID=259059 RepID=UPI0021C27C4B|nr:minor capsid protein [Liquorilactobacillus satsumensis]
MLRELIGISKNLDLQEQLAQSIIDGTGLDIAIAYLAPDNQLGLVPEPGSHVIEEDYAGNQDWQYNYAITIETKSSQEAKENLFTISQYLNGLTELNSENGSFVFQSLEVSSAPAEISQDIQGNIQYLLDIAVFVTTNKFEK